MLQHITQQDATLTAVVTSDKQPVVLQRYIAMKEGGGHRFQQQSLLSHGAAKKVCTGGCCRLLPPSAFDKASKWT